MIITPMHEVMRIEPATIEDLSLLAELLMELFGQEPNFRPDYNNQMRGLRLILEQPSRGRIFVLRSANKIIGMINLLFTISTAEGVFVILLEDLIVARHFRGFAHKGDKDGEEHGRPLNGLNARCRHLLIQPERGQREFE